MKAQITVNGKSIEIEISRNQAKELGLIDRKTTGFERVEEGEMYFCCSDTGGVKTLEETNHTAICNDQYKNGNYYSESAVAINNARANRLMYRLRQWQALHDRAISIKDWEDFTVTKFFIIYNYDKFGRKCRVYPTKLIREPNIIYFSTKEEAEEAIKIFKDELEWYFQKYQQRLDEEV